MKKIMLTMALIGGCILTGFSVNAQQTTKAPQATQQESIKLPDPPKFKSDTVNKGVNQMVTLLRQYAPAIRAMDTAKLAEFKQKIQALRQHSAWKSQILPEERQKFVEYFMSIQKILNPDATKRMEERIKEAKKEAQDKQMTH